MVQPKDETKDLIISKTENCETLIKQTHRKAEETFEFKLIKPRKTIRLHPPITIEGSWKIGLTSLEVYNSIFIKTEEKNKVELYTDFFDELFREKLKDELEEMKSQTISYNMKE